MNWEQLKTILWLRWRLTLPIFAGSPGFGLLAEDPGREVVIGVVDYVEVRGKLAYDHQRRPG